MGAPGTHQPRGRQPGKGGTEGSYKPSGHDLTLDGSRAAAHTPIEDPWADAGFESGEAHGWYNQGFSVEDARRYRDAGLSPWAAATWRQGGTSPEGALAWYENGGGVGYREIGLTPDEATQWAYYRMSPEDTESWTKRGYGPGEAAMWMSDPVKAATTLTHGTLPDGTTYPPLTAVEATELLEASEMYTGSDAGKRSLAANWSHSAAEFLGEQSAQSTRTNREEYHLYGMRPEMAGRWGRYRIRPKDAIVAEVFEISSTIINDVYQDCERRNRRPTITPEVSAWLQTRILAEDRYVADTQALIERLRPIPGFAAPPISPEDQQLVHSFHSHYQDLFPSDPNVYSEAATLLNVDVGSAPEYDNGPYDPGTRRAEAVASLERAIEEITENSHRPSRWLGRYQRTGARDASDPEGRMIA